MHKKPRESPDIFRNYWYGRTCMCIAILFFCFTSALLDAEAHSERTAPITYPGRSRLAGYGRVPCPTLLWRESMVLQFSVQACTSVTMSHATPMVEPWPAYFSKWSHIACSAACPHTGELPCHIPAHHRRCSSWLLHVGLAQDCIGIL